MNADWRSLSRRAGLRLTHDGIEVSLADQRSQILHADAFSEDTIKLWSVVARPAALARLRTPLVDAWRRNRYSELVGFTLDTRGRMIGEAWVPTAGLTSDEWGYYVQLVAEACDRFQYLITGRDES
jgi:hypothetical protein